MGWVRLVFFLLISTLLLVFTLRRPQAHRGYRFLAFECVLALIFLQADVWFVDPLRPLQIISWVVLGGSIAIALHSFCLLNSQGAPDQDLENTTKLITTGAYRYIRHPLYASLMLFGVGAALKQLTPVSIGILLGLLIAIYATGRVEEGANLDRFGEGYSVYMQRTKMFIPYLW